MVFLLPITMSYPCALSKQVAGAGCWCWCWCCELAVHVVETGCWCRCWCWVPGAGCRCWCCELAVHAVETGCWCWCWVPGAGAGAVSWLCTCTWWRQVAGGDRLLVPVLGAGCRCWGWCCELAVHVHVVETGCWRRAPVLVLRAGAGAVSLGAGCVRGGEDFSPR